MKTEDEKPSELIKPVPPAIVFTCGVVLIKLQIDVCTILGVAILSVGTVYLFARIVMWFIKASKQLYKD